MLNRFPLLIPIAKSLLPAAFPLLLLAFRPGTIANLCVWTPRLRFAAPVDPVRSIANRLLDRLQIDC